MNKRVNSLPLADVAFITMELDALKTWHVTSPCPPISESDCVNQVGSNASSQALHGMRVVEMARFALPPW